MYFVSHTQITTDNLVWNEIYERFYIFLWIWKISKFGTIENLIMNSGWNFTQNYVVFSNVRQMLFLIYFCTNTKQQLKVSDGKFVLIF